MDYTYDIAQNNIGFIIKSKRILSGISQSMLAEGICSQPLVSAIEKGSYMPNAFLLYNLCVRLNIDMNIFFQSNRSKLELLKKADEFCRDQKYDKLSNILDELNSHENELNETEIQMVVFYKVTLSFRSKKRMQGLIAELNYALELTYYPQKKNPSIQERLLLAQQGVLYRIKRKQKKSIKLFNLALSGIWNEKQYSEHSNEVFLLYLFTLSLNETFEVFHRQVDRITGYIASNQSHYLLGSMYYLLWQKSVENSQYISAKKAHDKFIVLDKLFHEPILKLTD